MNTEFYAGRIIDREALKNSSSGGIFTALSDHVLEQGGAVACSSFHEETGKLSFALVETKTQRDRARGSKYFQSDAADIYAKCLNWIKANPGKKLLFIGVGCQSAAFRRYAELKGISEDTIIADIICHGVPSQSLWLDYLQSLELKYGGKCEYLTFKDKRINWKNPTAVIRIGDTEIPLDEYVRVYNRGLSLRPACYACPYASAERTTDITIGDYWGIENNIPDFYDEMGNSLIILHTDKGKKLFEAVSDRIVTAQTTLEKCTQHNLVRPTDKPKEREKFWKDYHNKGVSYVMRHYGAEPRMRVFRRETKKAVKRLLRLVLNQK